MGSRSHLTEPSVGLLSESVAHTAPKFLNCLALHFNFLGRQLYPTKLTDLWAKTVDLVGKKVADKELALACETEWAVTSISFFFCCSQVSDFVVDNNQDY